jgi:hypothetical protein
VNLAPDCKPNGPRFPGSRAHQLRPTVFRLPGIISEFFAAGLAARSRGLTYFQRTVAMLREGGKIVNDFLA